MRFLIFALCFYVLLSSVEAEIRQGYVLEYWADTCPHVGIYQFASAAPHPQTEETMREMLHIYPGRPRSDFELLDVKVTLVSKLRGSPPDVQSIVCAAFSKFPESKPVGFNAVDQFLLFMGGEEPDKVLPCEVISLTRSPTAAQLEPALRPDFTVLMDRKMIERVVRERIAVKPLATPVWWRDPQSGMTRVEVPSFTAAFDAIYAGSACYLIMPKDVLPYGVEVSSWLLDGKTKASREDEEEVIPLSPTTFQKK